MDHPALKRIEKKIKQKRDEMVKLSEELRYLEVKKEKMILYPVICSVCEGTGEGMYHDVNGDRDWKDCSVCDGLGVIRTYRCNCGFVIDEENAVFGQKYNYCPCCGARLVVL